MRLEAWRSRLGSGNYLVEINQDLSVIFIDDRVSFFFLFHLVIKTNPVGNLEPLLHIAIQNIIFCASFRTQLVESFQSTYLSRTGRHLGVLCHQRNTCCQKLARPALPVIVEHSKLFFLESWNCAILMHKTILGFQAYEFEKIIKNWFIFIFFNCGVGFGCVPSNRYRLY